MNRYRNWVGALHWGQLLLLLPSLLFVGVAVGGGAMVYADDVGQSERYEFDAAETALREDSARVFGPMTAREALALAGAPTKPPANDRYAKLADLYQKALAEADASDDPAAYKERARSAFDRAVAKAAQDTAPQPLDLSYEAFLRRPLDTNLVRAVENAQAANERMKSLGTWVLGVGMFGWAFAWLTAFLSLWWWFGARAKPKGAQ